MSQKDMEYYESWKLIEKYSRIEGVLERNKDDEPAKFRDNDLTSNASKMYSKVIGVLDHPDKHVALLVRYDKKFLLEFPYIVYSRVTSSFINKLKLLFPKNSATLFNDMNQVYQTDKKGLHDKFKLVTVNMKPEAFKVLESYQQKLF
ncbi:hypothetical protein MHBO_001793, partial [Bonamia ostreae]